MLPGLRAKPRIVPYENVMATGRFYKHTKPETEEERLYREFVEKERRQWERDHIFTLPFRQAWDKIKRFFRFLRGIFTDDGFVVLKCNGVRGKWRLNDKPAWILEGGKPFDSIVKQNFATSVW